jgi:2-polyprenyl-3-methyl-5-hydroxy-6-metoxy-1,4-benzoquinol methylase
MDEAYAHAYGNLARQHWWWQVRDSVIMGALDRWMDPRERGRVLDVGCGDGRLFEALTKFGPVEGIEPHETTHSADSSTGLIHHIPFTTPLPIHGPYRLITMFDVLEHLDDVDDALVLCRDLLHERGVLCLTVPAMKWLWTSHDKINHHRLRFTRGDLLRRLRRAGMTVRWSRYFFHALVLPKLAIHVAERLREARPAVPKTPPVVWNRAAERFFRIEARLTAPVANLLPGSSLIAIATRTGCPES